MLLSDFHKNILRSKQSQPYLCTEQQLKNIRRKWFSTVSHRQPSEGYVKRVRATEEIFKEFPLKRQMKTQQLAYDSGIMHLSRPEHKEMEICLKLLRNWNNKQDEIPWQLPGNWGLTFI